MTSRVRSVRPLRIQSRRPGPATLVAMTRSPRGRRASQVPRMRFGAPLRRGVRRHRIHLRGIDEVDALRHRVVELRVRLGFGVLLAPGHGAEADLGNVQLRAGKRSIFHCRLSRT